MEYVDLYLVHWPIRFKSWAEYPVPNEEDFEELDMESTWAGMEKCLELGLCKAIGVSNFSTKKLQHLLDFASVCPAVNQVYFLFLSLFSKVFIIKIKNKKVRDVYKYNICYNYLGTEESIGKDNLTKKQN